MRARECQREHEVVAAARRGSIDEALLAHAKGCAICSEAAAVASALRSLDDDDLPARSTLDARVLWLKAQLAPMSIQGPSAENASQGVFAIWAAVAACWTIFITWRWSDLKRLLETISPERLLMGAGHPAALPVASLAVVVLMAAVTLAIMLHQVFVEEL
ncbi:MAG: hypothetical protein WC538_17045 [Thermoanaerobaculia bacterium]|jgi:hypothetical protein